MIAFAMSFSFWLVMAGAVVLVFRDHFYGALMILAGLSTMVGIIWHTAHNGGVDDYQDSI